MGVTKILEMRLLARYGAMITGAWVLLAGTALAQDQGRRQARFLEFSYGFQFPYADMRDRFGANTAIGAAFQSVSLGHRVMAGVEARYLFGNTVREDVIAGLRSHDGNIIGIDGYPADVILKERGFYTGLAAGKILGIGNRANNLTGIRLQLGAGLLQHKIRVQDNFNTVVPLDQKYIKGYDRLTNGLAFKLVAGFQYHHPGNNFHFHITGDLLAARTASRRSFDFATGSYLGKKRLDILAGLNLAYVVGISGRHRPEHIYY